MGHPTPIWGVYKPFTCTNKESRKVGGEWVAPGALVFESFNARHTPSEDASAAATKQGMTEKG